MPIRCRERQIGDGLGSHHCVQPFFMWTGEWGDYKDVTGRLVSQGSICLFGVFSLCRRCQNISYTDLRKDELRVARLCLKLLS